MTFDEEKRGWAFAGAEGIETESRGVRETATEAHREELSSMTRRLAELRAK